jgi:hypothetical protein
MNRCNIHPINQQKKSFQDFEAARIKKHEKKIGKKPAGNKCYH